MKSEKERIGRASTPRRIQFPRITKFTGCVIFIVEWAINEVKKQDRSAIKKMIYFVAN